MEMNASDTRDTGSTARLTRREAAIASLGTMATVIAWGQSAGSAEPSDEPKIDCHVHFYDPTRPEGVPWPSKDNPTLYMPRMPQDFLAVAQPHGVTKCIVIEASSWFQDNRWLLELAAKEPCIAGVVGRVAPADETFAARIADLARDQRFRGIRVGVTELRLALADPAVLTRLGALIERNLTLDVNGSPAVLESLAAFAPRLPELRIVLNHMANPPIDGRQPPQDWLDGIRKVGAARNVYCKWSAYVEHAPQLPASTDLDLYRPVFDHVWREFGAERILFGSDWPVSDKAADYGSIVKIADAYLASRTEEDRRRCFRTNTLRAYAIT